MIDAIPEKIRKLKAEIAELQREYLTHYGWKEEVVNGVSRWTTTEPDGLKLELFSNTAVKVQRKRLRPT